MLKYHIQTIEAPSGGSASFVFNSVPQVYDDLFIVFSARTTQAISSWSDIGLRFNGDASNYTSRVLYGAGEGSAAGLSETSIFMRVSPANNTANTFASYQAYIPNYRSNTPKSVSIQGGNETNATQAILKVSSSLWNSTAAINTVSLVPQSGVLVQFSSASLYGIKRGSDGRTEVASGGTITTSGGFTIHTFTGSGTFVANRDLNVDYLVVAGGGGGGEGNGGAGGGAGGYSASSLSLSPNSYSVIVGAGGAGAQANSRGVNGSNSVFASITSLGGGGGGSGGTATNGAGANGGSGGGSTRGESVGLGAAGQGFNGGTSINSGQYGTGGGGGAGALGGNGSTTNGNGGSGLASSITGTAVTRAGGGGGGQTDGNLGGASSGGSGGGGAGGVSNGVGGTGSANTGSGGGGGGGNGGDGGPGGSGVVIIRYLTPA